MKAIFLDDAGVTGRKRSSDQPILLLGGIIIDIDRMPEIHRRFENIRASIFGGRSRASLPEIHARPIVSGKGPFRSLTMDDRLKIFKEIYNLIDECEGDICYVVFVKDNYVIGREHPYNIAFQLLCERIEGYLERRDEYALIFMDRNSDVEQELVRNLSSFRAQGFNWGTPRRERVTRIIGALHSVDSEHDIFIQMADLVVYGLYQRETLIGSHVDLQKGRAGLSRTRCLREAISTAFRERLQMRQRIAARWPTSLYPFAS